MNITKDKPYLSGRRKPVFELQSHGLLFLLVITFVLLLSGLPGTPMYILDEVKNAQCAREMMQRNDWILPTFNGELRAAKPPLHYFFMRAGYMMLGDNPMGARFFSTIMGMLTIASCWFFIRRYSSPLHAFISCCVLIASTHFLFEFRLAVPDPYLIFFTTICLFSTFTFFQENNKAWLFVAAITMGLGILSKGPVALVIPGLAVLGWIIWEKKFSLLFHRNTLFAALIMVSVAAPWYIAVHVASKGAWTKGFFIDNNLDRFSNSMEGHGGIFLLIPLFILLGLLPATVFTFEALRSKRRLWSNPFNRFAICVVMANLVIFSLSGTKLPNYPMPAYPFTALLLGSWLTSSLESTSKPRKYPFIILVVLNLILVPAVYFALANETALDNEKNLSWWMLVLLAGSTASLYLFSRKGFKPALQVLFLTYGVFHILFFTVMYPTVYLQNPATASKTSWQDSPSLAAYAGFNPAFVYHRNAFIPQFNDSATLRNYLQTHPGTVIVAREEKAEILDSMGLMRIESHHDIFENQTTVLYKE